MKRQRRSLGPRFSNMNCPACGQPTLQGLLDRNGVPYLSDIGGCRFRVLSASIETIAVFRFISDLLEDPEFRAAWAKARGSAIDQVRVPSPASRVEETKEVEGGERS